MCGIAGFLRDPAAAVRYDSAAVAERMACRICHRGPDDADVWTDPDAGVALGHRRLAIIDLSPEGHQPMRSASGRYVVAFNGEIYNYQELRSELAAGPAAPRWRGHSDTEVMLAAFERWGVAGALKRFNGMFALALWDREARVLYLARDRAGEKPVYYGWSGSTFLFGSELKALRVHPDWRGEIDRRALALFMRHNYIPAPYSIYVGVAKLLPGTVLSMPWAAGRAGPYTIEPYWSARDVAAGGTASPLSLADAEAAESLDNLLRDAVRLRMVADVPLGAFLSGGVDSAVVVALMQAQSAAPVRTFTIGFAESGYDEAPHAKAVARHLGTDHTELYVTPDQAMAVIPRLPSLYDEPFADSSQIPTFLIAQLARQHVTVALSGDGGDELFGGYNRYFWGQALWRRLRWVPRPVRTAAAQGIRAVSTETWEAIARPFESMVPSRWRVRRPGEKVHRLAEVLDAPDPVGMYESLITHWDPAYGLVRDTVEPPTVITTRSEWAHVRDFTHTMMYLDLVTYLPDDILVKIDRASMGVSLEARVPLLDHRVIEFAWRLPLSMKIRGGQGKHLLRQVLYRYVPRSMIERPKMGFGVPIGTWLRGPLRDWAETLLDPPTIRAAGLLDAAVVRERWSQHLSGARDWQYHLWDVLVFQAWLAAQE